MAFPTVNSITTGASSAGATTHTVTLPATINVNDLLLVMFTVRGGTGVTVTWDNTTAGTWTTVGNTTSGANIRGMLMSKVAVGTEGSAALSIGLSVSQQVAWIVIVVSGADGAVETTTINSATTTWAFNPLTPTWGAADTLWLAAAHINNAGAVTVYSTGYSGATRIAATGTNTVATAYCWAQINAATEDPTDWTGGAVQVIGRTVAIKPSAAVAGISTAWLRV